jgi:predicted ArsR family transcriptional regulator
MTAPMFGPGQYDLILRLAARRMGCTRSEVADRWGASFLNVWRAFKRLEEQGLIWATPLRRRDPFSFAKRPSVIFKARWRPRRHACDNYIRL